MMAHYMSNPPLDRQQAHSLALETLTGREQPRSPTWGQSHHVPVVYEEEEGEEELEEDYYDENTQEIIHDDFDDDGSIISLPPDIVNETINFDHVYALHKFEATIDGQVSVEKGEALELQDDSNAYWWLVKGKKSCIGYIPAEHIELASERLARLNKTKNVERTEALPEDIYNSSRPKRRGSRRVEFSKDVDVQAQIVLVENVDDAIDESSSEPYDVYCLYSKEDIQWMEEELLTDDEDEYDYDGDEMHTIPSTERDNTRVTASAMTTLFGDRITQPLRRWVSRSKKNEMSVKTKIADDTSSEIASSVSFTSTSSVSDYSDAGAAQSRPGIRVPSLLRVYGGRTGAAANFTTVQVEEDMSAQQILDKVLKKFNLDVNRRGIEYYLAAKKGDEEVQLAPNDKPMQKIHTLLPDRPTPTPPVSSSVVSLTRKLSQSTAKQVDNQRDETPIQFFLDQRIKRLEESSGKARVKISYYGETETVPNQGKENIVKAALSGRSLGRQKAQVVACRENDRIIKLVEVPTNISIRDLTLKALEKFNISQHVPFLDEPLTHGIFISSREQGGQEIRLDESEILSYDAVILRRVRVEKPTPRPTPPPPPVQTLPIRSSSQSSKPMPKVAPPIAKYSPTRMVPTATHSIPSHNEPIRRVSHDIPPPLQLDDPIHKVDHLLGAFERSLPMAPTPRTPNSRFYRISKSIVKPSSSYFDDLESELDHIYCKLATT